MKVIAITGGPCAGKTSAMDVLRERIAEVGARALFVPEAATDLILSGIAPWTCSSMLEFQTRVIELQLEREAEAFETAASAGIGLIVCDRGICDSRAYLSGFDYACALAANGLDEQAALTRYDAVFHLESIAKSNPEAYTKGNNGARFETAAEAVVADDRGIIAWCSHPAFKVVANCEDFADKADVLWREVASFCGLDTPLLVSACLLGEPCRYDGASQPCPPVIALEAHRKLVAVCPEQLGGLPTPRTPSEIQPDGRIVDAHGIDRTEAFKAGAREALRIAREHGCTQAILKSNSPSCGTSLVYDGSFSGKLVPGKGVTASLLEESGIEVRSEQ